MNISPEDFGALFDSFNRDAFRLEALDDYTGSSSAENLRAYASGEEKPADYNAGWLEQVGRNTAAGKRMYRVHIVSRPLTNYLRYELDWGYRTNVTAGEEFFVLDTTEKPNPLEGVPDFWMFDESTVVSMDYDQGGGFLGAEQEDDAQKWMHWRDVAMSHAEPFADWWERYGNE